MFLQGEHEIKFIRNKTSSHLPALYHLRLRIDTTGLKQHCGTLVIIEIHTGSFFELSNSEILLFHLCIHCAFVQRPYRIIYCYNYLKY